MKKAEIIGMLKFWVFMGAVIGLSALTLYFAECGKG